MRDEEYKTAKKYIEKTNLLDILVKKHPEGIFNFEKRNKLEEKF